MKHITRILTIMMATLLLFGAVSCGSGITLEGKYVLDTKINETSYTFEKNGKVTVQSISLGVVLFTLEGTYEISEDGSQITLSLPTTDGTAADGSDQSALSGTFTFEQGEASIKIGMLEYKSADAQ
ncbi:MAG: hypothetical protein IJ493_00225 [Clostridia bacterium]|nr:hypothetical protein [Clostridia bacterium]